MVVDDRLQLLVRQVRDLPALPSSALRVMHMTDSQQASAAEVARVLYSDQAMTARLLKLANSAFYGAPRHVSTVTEAIVLLGMRTVRNMTMALACHEMLARALPGYLLRENDLWRHSLCCAQAAQCLARRTGYRLSEEAFVGGLLHDIGKVILNTYMQAEFAQVLQRVVETPQPFMDAERDVLGFDHAEVGARILAKWNLPQPLVDCVRFHHMPLAQPSPTPLAALVHVADILSLMLGVGLGGDGLYYPLQEGVFEMLGLSETDFEDAAAQISHSFSDSPLTF